MIYYKLNKNHYTLFTYFKTIYFIKKKILIEFRTTMVSNIRTDRIVFPK